jgi:ribosome-associated heat shock protein Hsp15
VKHRSLAVEMVGAGAVRLNHAVIAKSSHTVKPGDVLTLAVHGEIRVIRVLAEGARRGPAPEARLLYEEVGSGKSSLSPLPN